MAAPRKSNYRLPENQTIPKAPSDDDSEENEYIIEESEDEEEDEEDSETDVKNDGPTPNKFDINKLKRKREEIMFKDQHGNLYGLLDNRHTLYNRLEESGEIDNDHTFLAWVSLPRLVRSNETTYSHFPGLGETIKIFNGHNNDYIRSFNIRSYPERRKTTSRSTSVILESQI